MDYYIKSTGEKSLWESLESAGLAYKQYDREDPLNAPTAELDWVPTGKFTWVSKTQLDIVGTIYVQTGDTVEALEGFHANVRDQLTEEQQSLLPLIDAPSTPSRVWA